jgi:hypothetical protein
LSRHAEWPPQNPQYKGAAEAKGFEQNAELPNRRLSISMAETCTSIPYLVPPWLARSSRWILSTSETYEAGISHVNSYIAICFVNRIPIFYLTHHVISPFQRRDGAMTHLLSNSVHWLFLFCFILGLIWGGVFTIEVREAASEKDKRIERDRETHRSRQLE